MKLLILLLAAAAALPLAKPEAEVRPDPLAPASSAKAATAATALVIFGNDTVRAEVANTPETRSRGLMFHPETGAAHHLESREVRRSFDKITIVLAGESPSGPATTPPSRSRNAPTALFGVCS